MAQSPNRLIGVALGVAYLLIGVLGLWVTTGIAFVVPSGPKLFTLFEINPLSNVAHLVVASALLIAGMSDARAARRVNAIVGAVYLLLALAGLVIGGLSSPLNLLAMNSADNVLHLATALVLLVVAIAGDRRRHAPRIA